MKKAIPNKTLPRYNGTKRKWLAPINIEIKESKEKYNVSFITRRNKGFYRVEHELPKRLEITDRFKCALVAYICEGTNQTKGLYSKFSGQKTKNVHISNSDPWVLKLTIDEFEKLGMKREKWRIRLDLFSQHNVEEEKLWWSKQLNVPIERIISCTIYEGDISKSHREPHGRAKAEIESVIFGSIVANLINLLKSNQI